MFTELRPRRFARIGALVRGLAARSLLGCAIVCGGGLADAVHAAARPAPAERLTAADRRAIEDTIRQQLDAFGRDDADRAFGFATPDIQRMFGSSDSFMQMVRDHYEAVYRATGVQFERLALTDGQWVQTARLTDDEGKVWRALFTMRRQAGGWKVGGCQLVETSALST